MGISTFPAASASSGGGQLVGKSGVLIQTTTTTTLIINNSGTYFTAIASMAADSYITGFAYLDTVGGSPQSPPLFTLATGTGGLEVPIAKAFMTDTTMFASTANVGYGGSVIFPIPPRVAAGARLAVSAEFINGTGRLYVSYVAVANTMGQ